MNSVYICPCCSFNVFGRYTACWWQPVSCCFGCSLGLVPIVVVADYFIVLVWIFVIVVVPVPVPVTFPVPVPVTVIVPWCLSSYYCIFWGAGSVVCCCWWCSRCWWCFFFHWSCRCYVSSGLFICSFVGVCCCSLYFSFWKNFFAVFRMMCTDSFQPCLGILNALVISLVSSFFSL